MIFVNVSVGVVNGRSATSQNHWIETVIKVILAIECSNWLLFEFVFSSGRKNVKKNESKKMENFRYKFGIQSWRVWTKVSSIIQFDSYFRFIDGEIVFWLLIFNFAEFVSFPRWKSTTQLSSLLLLCYLSFCALSTVYLIALLFQICIQFNHMSTDSYHLLLMYLVVQNMKMSNDNVKSSGLRQEKYEYGQHWTSTEYMRKIIQNGNYATYFIKSNWWNVPVNLVEGNFGFIYVAPIWNDKAFYRNLHMNLIQTAMFGLSQ